MKLTLISFLLLVASGQDCCNKKDTCRGEPLKDCMCIQLYKPVCGCDGKTYSNDCHARCAGIKEWKEGECPSKQ